MVSCEIRKKGEWKLLYNEWLGWGVFNDSMSQLHSSEFVIVFGRKVGIISTWKKWLSAIQLQEGNYSIHNYLYKT